LIVLLLPASAGAHRLDEYLQAMRVDVERNRISLDIDLTPGVSIASRVTSWIDTNGDNVITPAESLAYGRQVLQSLTLSIDDVATPIELIDVHAPTIADMAGGIGTLRLRAAADMPAAPIGSHHLSLINSHHPESSVYLANALVPADTTIRIVAQKRTIDQHSFGIDYEVETTVNRARVSWLLAATTLLTGTVLVRRGLVYSKGRSTPN